ncbi:protein xpaC [Virgibacillus sp. MSP4-1]|uniref:5-bromo-4-chloroindolyl phosphate hydrolysis family protein n=1 Tax=Virgibacillus sp. MSP4-1 TaxID=2700081 RepID=UPI00039C7AB4|nr:5-bromo-4-chloroindolyl phosphate hydrolysis family protein [Virgibacillus sp. MSP4-1]QHS21467.1 protein xpaC [Virgibacillus sp. MSP4-1]
MYKFLTIIIRIAVAIPAMITVWLVSFFLLDLSFLSSSGVSLIGAAMTYGIITGVLYFRSLKKNELTMKDYRYIRKQLIEAKHKIRRMHKTLLSIRQVTFFKEMFDLLRTIRKIYQVTKKEPKRFYQGNQFYFSHLDSAVELTEKYAFLYSQPKKSREMEQVLDETRSAIKDMKTAIEKDLYHILSDDIEELNFEVDYTKYTTNPKQERLDFDGQQK